MEEIKPQFVQEDKNIEHRQELYLEEGKAYYDGNLFVPDDLDVIEL